MRASLEAIQTAHAMRAVSRRVVRGAPPVGRQRQDASNEDLAAAVSGTRYEVFVLGLHDPDDAVTARYVV